MTRTKQSTRRIYAETPHDLYIQKLHKDIKSRINMLNPDDIYRLADRLSLNSVINPNSGRRIRINGPTYKQLKDTMTYDERGELLRKEMVTNYLSSIGNSESV